MPDESAGRIWVDVEARLNKLDASLSQAEAKVAGSAQKMEKAAKVDLGGISGAFLKMTSSLSFVELGLKGLTSGLKLLSGDFAGLEQSVRSLPMGFGPALGGAIDLMRTLSGETRKAARAQEALNAAAATAKRQQDLASQTQAMRAGLMGGVLGMDPGSAQDQINRAHRRAQEQEARATALLQERKYAQYQKQRSTEASPEVRAMVREQYDITRLIAHQLDLEVEAITAAEEEKYKGRRDAATRRMQLAIDEANQERALQRQLAAERKQEADREAQAQQAHSMRITDLDSRLRIAQLEQQGRTDDARLEAIRSAYDREIAMAAGKVDIVARLEQLKALAVAAAGASQGGGTRRSSFREIDRSLIAVGQGAAGMGGERPTKVAGIPEMAKDIKRMADAVTRGGGTVAVAG